jgi:hypothetical protein
LLKEPKKMGQKNGYWTDIVISIERTKPTVDIGFQ